MNNYILYVALIIVPTAISEVKPSNPAEYHVTYEDITGSFRILNKRVTKEPEDSSMVTDTVEYEAIKGTEITRIDVFDRIKHGNGASVKVNINKKRTHATIHFFGQPKYGIDSNIQIFGKKI